MDVWTHLCESFLGLKSLVRLDTALQNHDIRAKFHVALSRVQISSPNFYCSNVSTFDAVPCVRWIASRGVSIYVLIVPTIRSRSILPHFSKPHLLENMHTLNLLRIHERYFGWLETMLALCINLKHICVATLAVLPVVSDYCTNLESFTIISLTNDYPVVETKEKELRTFLRNCKKLPRVIVYNCTIQRKSVLELITKRVEFVVPTDKTTYTMFAPLIDCAVCVQHKDYILCRGVPEDVVAKSVRAIHSTVSKDDPCTLVQFHVGLPDFILRVANYFKFVYVLQMDNCTAMTAETLAALCQLRYLCGVVLHNNTTIQEFPCTITKHNEELVLFTIRSFTALTQTAVQHMLELCPRAEVIVENMPQITTDGGRIKERSV